MRIAALLLTACTVTSTTTDEQSIIGGEAAPDDASVVLLIGYPANRSTSFTCTASVISPTALLTAAHCIDHPGYSYGVFYGADGSGTLTSLLPQLAPVTSVHMYPSYNRNAPFTGDVAVVKLTNPAPVPALPFLRVAPTPGVPARIVGYGQETYGTYNATRRKATTMVAAIDTGDTITVGDADRHTCIGDSGGPALVMIDGVEHVVGVNSYGPNGCTGPAHFRRTDLYASFVDPFAGTMPPAPDPMDPVDDPPPEMTEDEGGGCASTSGGGLVFVLLSLCGIARRTSRGNRVATRQAPRPASARA